MPTDPSSSAALTPGAITLLRDGHRLAVQGGTFPVEWADWARRVSEFLQDYDAAVAAIKAKRRGPWTGVEGAGPR